VRARLKALHRIRGGACLALRTRANLLKVGEGASVSCAARLSRITPAPLTSAGRN